MASRGANNRNRTNSYYTTAANSYYTTATNSYNTTGNSRSYLGSEHIEVRGSTFYIGDTPRQPHYRTRKDLEKIVETKIDWDILRGQLSVADQDRHLSTISPLDWNEPKYFWITKNIDFTQWVSDASSQALWLSGPDHRGMKEVSSLIIGAAKEKAIQPNSSVLYFFCSTATTTRGSIATVFAHTLLYQIVRSSSADKTKLIAVAFLKALLGDLSRFTESYSPSAMVEAILNVPDKELYKPLVEAFQTAEIQELSIVIDGVDITVQEDRVFVQNVYCLVKHMMNLNSKFKALITSPQNSDLQNMLGRLPCIEYDKERKECLRFLKHDDTRYGHIVKEHHGSLQWLWKHPKYLQWSASSTSSLLYIEGKPGSGKSTLAKYFRENLLVWRPNTDSKTVGHYFYSLRGTQSENTHENMLRSILHSILDRYESAFFHFQLEFRKFRHRDPSEWRYYSLKTVLSSLAYDPPTRPLYLILDAMDESEEEGRHSIIQFLCGLCSAKYTCVKVFLASRPVAELTHQIDESHHVIRLQDENKHDIQKFVYDFLPHLRLTGPVRHYAAEYIIANAEGVFVWVHLVKADILRMIATGYNEMQIMDRLKILPKELLEYYQLMLHKLAEEGSDLDIQDGKKMFQFVLFSFRPLKVAELQHILAIPEDRNYHFKHIPQKFKRNQIKEIEKRIMHCGGNFLEITGNKTVQLIHQTAREFLLRIQPSKLDSRFELGWKEAHRAFVTVSLRYLMLCFTYPESVIQDTFSGIKTWGSNDFQKYVRYINEWPWINYALHNLKAHYDLCSQKGNILKQVHVFIKLSSQNPGSEFLGDWMACQFGQTKSALDFLRSVTSLRHNRNSKNFKFKVLDAAAALQFFQLFESLLPACTQIDAWARSETPLILCVKEGLINASQMLIYRNENLNAKDIAGQTALHHAAKNGYEAIIRLLLERGADKMAKDYHGLIPLELALKTL